jgi:formate transporter
MSSSTEPRVSLTDLKLDPYSPAEMAGRAQAVGEAKARLDLINLLTLAVLAGAFISLGAGLATVAGIESTLGWGPTRILVGTVFSVGLILVVIAGAELFTGNTLLIMAWLGRRVTSWQLARNWTVAYLGNFVGALATVGLVYYAGQWALGGNRVGIAALETATAKVQLSFMEAVMRGILCNAMVNLAVWLCLSARSNADKIFAIIPPIGGFVAAGFEHSIANMYFIPIGILLKGNQAVMAESGLGAEATGNLTWGGFLLDNLLPVTIGNIIGGAVMVAAIYWLVYLRPKPATVPLATPSDDGSGGSMMQIPADRD